MTTSPKGHCVWGVIPFAPKPPFEIYVEDGDNAFGDVRQFVTAARSGEPEFNVLSPVKARPVVVITDVLAPWDEVLVLRLKKLSKIENDADRQRVLDHKDSHLFHLVPHRFTGLPEENAVMATTLTRVPVSALDLSSSLGKLDENELRVLHERIATINGLDLKGLIIPKAKQLLKDRGVN